MTVNELSTKAYNLLDRRVENEDMAGYLIYSNGTSVAIAYSNPDLIDDVMKVFVTSFLEPKKGVIELKSGTLAANAFNLYEYYDELDEALRNEQWSELEAEVSAAGYDGKKTVDAFKKLVKTELDSEEMREFFAQLEKLSESHKCNFVLSVSVQDDSVPDYIRQYAL